jgi:NitT/TauT family transport system substrate-binding protein
LTSNLHRALRIVVTLGAALGLVACGAAVQPSASSAPAPQKIRTIFGSVNYAQMLVPLALDTGLFQRNGLDAEVIQAGNALPALIANEAQIVVTSSEDIITADEAGANLAIVGTISPYAQLKLLVRPEIATVADLKGRPVGVSKRGNSSQTALKWAVESANMNADRDLQIVEFGTSDKEVAGLAGGSIYAAAFPPPLDEVAVSQGQHVLIDFGAQHILYPGAQITVSRDWAAKNQSTVLAYLKSLAQAAQLLRTDPDQVTTVFAKWAKADQDAARKAVALANQAVPVDMLPTAEGIANVQATVAEVVPSAGSADPKKYFDDSYIRRLENDGFYKNLSQQPAK